ncbi:MAG: DUF4388 domain-containing protein [Ktedonobacterales bacterium]|nr:DUF4388 domain-containing protein [Ktedonobacterales bacterium]
MTNQQQEQGRIIGGDLETLGLQATLKMLALGGKTGQLSVAATHDAVDGRTVRERLDIYLKKGNIVALNSSDPAPIDLLELLRLMRRIHRKDATEIHDQVGTHLPYVLAALLERNLISAGELQQRMEFAIIQEIARAMRWQRGTFEFHVHVNVVETSMTPLSVDHVLLEAIRIMDEWSKVTIPELTRSSTPRWLPEFKGDISELSLSRDEIGVLFLANGQNPVFAIAYGLLTNEAQVAHSVERLVNMHLVEVVNDQLERQLEQSLTNALTVSRGQLKHDNRMTPEQRLQMLIHTMGTCINKLLSHHSNYARALRGKTVSNDDLYGYLEMSFLPLLRRAQRDHQIVEAVTFHDGELDYHELMDLNKLVRGDQLETFYWDAVQAFHQLMNSTFQMVIADEIGPTRASRRLNELWETFAQEVDAEMERQRVRRISNQQRRQQP